MTANNSIGAGISYRIPPSDPIIKLHKPESISVGIGCAVGNLSIFWMLCAWLITY